jgi:hypothetical protein
MGLKVKCIRMKQRVYCMINAPGIRLAALSARAPQVHQVDPSWQGDRMHETARYFGYPSDSTRAARERAREATCGYCLRWTGQAQPGRASLTGRGSATSPSLLRPCLSPLWLNSSLRRLSPLWLNSSQRRLSPTRNNTD